MKSDAVQSEVAKKEPKTTKSTNQVQSNAAQSSQSAATTRAERSDSSAHSGTLTKQDLEILKAPFSKDRLGVKVQTFNKDRTRAMLVLYLQHTDVQDRLEEVDPAWTSEVLHEEQVGDMVYVRLRMTLKGVSRENVGEGGDPKGAYSDALKRSAMLFGVGRYLYDSSTVWVEYNDTRDRYRQWSIGDYEQAASKEGVSLQSLQPSGKAPPVEPKSWGNKEKVGNVRPGLKAQVAPSGVSGSNGGPKKSTRSREDLNRALMNLYRPFLTKFPETRFVELLNARYSVGETRLMTVEQMEDFVQYLEEQLNQVA